jgi:hypothetical protein
MSVARAAHSGGERHIATAHVGGGAHFARVGGHPKLLRLD